MIGPRLGRTWRRLLLSGVAVGVLGLAGSMGDALAAPPGNGHLTVNGSAASASGGGTQTFDSVYTAASTTPCNDAGSTVDFVWIDANGQPTLLGMNLITHPAGCTASLTSRPPNCRAPGSYQIQAWIDNGQHQPQDGSASNLVAYDLTSASSQGNCPSPLPSPSPSPSPTRSATPVSASAKPASPSPHATPSASPKGSPPAVAASPSPSPCPGESPLTSPSPSATATATPSPGESPTPCPSPSPSTSPSPLPSPAKSGGVSPLVWVVLAIVVLGGGGGAGYYFFVMRRATPA